jgi:colanic acid biosynthesis glycosyl transferase WcaI
MVSETDDSPNLGKKILLISHNFSPEPTGIGKINGEMINWLANKGFQCTVITAFPYYPYWKIQPPYKNGWFKKEEINFPESNGSITIYRCPFYIPSKPTGKKRIVQDFSFWTSMSWIAGMFMLTKKKHDLIITVAPPFHLGYLGMLIKKGMGGKLVYHIQDLQIEAAQELNMLSNKKLLNYVYNVERDMIIKADYVSGISPGMIKKIKAKVDRDVIYFPNWVDVRDFHPLGGRETLKEKWGYQSDEIVFLYSGAIGEKQGLENILFTAEDLRDNKKIKFIICGSGPYKEKLMKEAEQKELSNINFLPVQDKELFNEFLNMADFHLILQKGNASDLVMPSKLATILAIGGVSIVTTVPGTSLHSLVEEHDLGYIIEPDNHQLLSNLIKDLKLDYSFDRKRKNARNYAIQHLNIDNVMNDFLDTVLYEENGYKMQSALI